MDAAASIIDKAMSEKDDAGNEGRAMTADERTEVRGLQTAAKEAQEQIDILREQLGLSDTADPGKLHLIKTAGSTRGANDAEEISEEEKRYADAFWKMHKHGERSLSNDDLETLHARRVESRDLSAGTDADGGFTVPTGFWPKLIDKQKAYTWFDAAGVSYLPTAQGHDMPFPVSDGTAEIGELIAENTAAATANPTFTQLTLGAYLFSSKQVRASRVLMQDSAIDIEGFLAKRLGERLGRIVAQYATTGTGTAQPYGVVTQASAGVTATGTTAITLDEIIDLQHSIDPAYRGNGRWMFHDNVLKYLRKLKDGDGRPLWMPSLIEGLRSTLLGDPYAINQNMSSTITASDITALYGDFSQFYVRTVLNPVLLMIDDSLREKFQYGYVMFQRMGSILSDTAAVKKLTQAAS
jgi:HK97 family phage major capsid protein